MVGRSEHRFSAARRARGSHRTLLATTAEIRIRKITAATAFVLVSASARYRYATAGQARRHINRQRLLGVGAAIANKQKSLVLAVGTPSHLAQFRNALTFNARGFDWVERANRGMVVPQAMPEWVRR